MLVVYLEVQNAQIYYIILLNIQKIYIITVYICFIFASDNISYAIYFIHDVVIVFIVCVWGKGLVLHCF